MKRCEYPLEALLELRHREVEEQQLNLAAAQSGLAEFEALREKKAATKSAISRQQIEEGEQFDIELMGGGLRVDQVALFEDRMSGLDEDVDEVEEEIREITLRVETARKAALASQEELSERISRREAMDQHQRQWRAELDRAEERGEWEELDPQITHRGTGGD